MNKEFFDFDKLFEEYMRARFSGKQNVNPELVKTQLGKLYHEWSETRLKILGDESPANYFKSIDDPKTLIEFLVKSCENDRRPNSFLLDRICEIPKSAELLRELISNHDNSTLTLTAIELLELMDAPLPLEDCIQILIDNYSDAELKDEIVEALSLHADKVKDSLFSILPTVGLELKILFAEILINAKHDPRTLALLTELFYEADDIPLIASYIGKYGDEALATPLYKALDMCNYMEYIEIKNAIERLGGIVEDVRDFSEDNYYKIINGNRI